MQFEFMLIYELIVPYINYSRYFTQNSSGSLSDFDNDNDAFADFYLVFLSVK